MKFYSESYASPGRGRWILKPDQEAGDVACFVLKSDGRKDYAKVELKGSETEDYLNDLTSVDDVKFKIDMIEKVELEQTVQLTVKFILDGKDNHGQIFQDRNFYRWYLSNEEGGSDAYDWKIRKDELVEGLRVGGDRRDFQGFETSQAGEPIGIDYKHERDPKLNIKDHGSELKFGVIEHGGGGVSAVDYNNDGRPDIFFADGKRSRLYRNDGVDTSGRFILRMSRGNQGWKGSIRRPRASLPTSITMVIRIYSSVVTSPRSSSITTMGLIRTAK